MQNALNKMVKKKDQDEDIKLWVCEEINNSRLKLDESIAEFKNIIFDKLDQNEKRFTYLNNELDSKF